MNSTNSLPVIKWIYFINSLKAIVAKKLGIPFDNLLVATNENRVLADVFKTGVYSTQDRKLVKTLSCAMVFGQKNSN